MTFQSGALPPESLLEPPLPPTWVPPNWAWPGPSPRPNQSYIPPWARAVSPAKLSAISTRPGLIPKRVHNPLSGKKRGLLVSTSSSSALPAHLRAYPTACLPPRSLSGHHLPIPPGTAGVARPSVSVPHLLLSLPSSFHADQGMGGRSQPR